MDCCNGGYVGEHNSGRHHPSSYYASYGQSPSTTGLRYPPQNHYGHQVSPFSPIYRGGPLPAAPPPPPGSIYEGYDHRYGYQNQSNSITNYGYYINGNYNTGYHHPNPLRDNSGYYNHHHPPHHHQYHHHQYDGYRIPTSYPGYHHNRDHYGADTLYNARNGYGMSYPGTGGANLNTNNGIGNNGIGMTGINGNVGLGVNGNIRDNFGSFYHSPRDMYGMQQHTISEIESLTNMGNHHSTIGSPFGEYNTSPIPSSPFGMMTASLGHGMLPNTTGYQYPIKEGRSRKLPREKEKTKTGGSLNRKTLNELSSSVTTPDVLERIGTPFMPPLQNYSDSQGSFPINSRFQNGYMSSQNWYPMHHQSNGWQPSGAFNSKGSFRKRNISPDSPLMTPPNNFTQQNGQENSKYMNGVLDSDCIPTKKSKRKTKAIPPEPPERKEELNITPLPGFQQAFGSTEIGRFSEAFFNISESPIEPAIESEADTLSPQPWETGDSLEGPHYNLQIGAAIQEIYPSEGGYGDMDSPNSGNYFSEIRCQDF